MTIRKGSPWGAPGALEPTAPVVGTDHDLVEALGSPDRPGDPGSHDPLEIGLTGGDLHRSVGSPAHDPEDLRAGRGMRLPVDLGVVEPVGFVPHRSAAAAVDTDGEPLLQFCAHLVCIRRVRGLPAPPLFARDTLVVMNAAYRKGANLAPRSHPNDGRLDVTEGRLGLWDSLRARRRMPTGTHVPHPRLHQRRVRTLERSFEHPMDLVVDSVAVGTATGVRVRCVPDALIIVV